MKLRKLFNYACTAALFPPALIYVIMKEYMQAGWGPLRAVELFRFGQEEFKTRNNKKNYKEAIEWYELALAAPGADKLPLEKLALNLGASYFFMDRYADAIEVLEPFLDCEKNSKYIKRFCAWSYYYCDNYNEAIRLALLALEEADPEDNFIANWYGILGRSYKKTESYDLAIDYFHKFFDLASPDKISTFYVDNYFLCLGMQERWDEILESAQKFSDKPGLPAAAISMAARAAFVIEDYKSALGWLEMIAPADYEKCFYKPSTLISMTVRCYIELKRYEEIPPYLHEHMKTTTEKVHLSELPQHIPPSERRKILSSIPQEHVQDLFCHNMKIAWSYFEEEDYRRAEIYYVRALELETSDIENHMHGYYMLVMALLFQKKNNEAEKKLEEALGIFPDGIHLLYLKLHMLCTGGYYFQASYLCAEMLKKADDPESLKFRVQHFMQEISEKLTLGYSPDDPGPDDFKHSWD